MARKGEEKVESVAQKTKQNVKELWKDADQVSLARPTLEVVCAPAVCL